MLELDVQVHGDIAAVPFTAVRIWAFIGLVNL
jgi:hypothetical protein